MCGTHILACQSIPNDKRPMQWCHWRSQGTMETTSATNFFLGCIIQQENQKYLRQNMFRPKAIKGVYRICQSYCRRGYQRKLLRPQQGWRREEWRSWGGQFLCLPSFPQGSDGRQKRHWKGGRRRRRSEWVWRWKRLSCLLPPPTITPGWEEFNTVHIL